MVAVVTGLCRRSRSSNCVLPADRREWRFAWAVMSGLVVVVDARAFETSMIHFISLEELAVAQHRHDYLMHCRWWSLVLPHAPPARLHPCCMRPRVLRGLTMDPSGSAVDGLKAHWHITIDGLCSQRVCDCHGVEHA